MAWKDLHSEIEEMFGETLVYDTRTYGGEAAHDGGSGARGGLRAISHEAATEAALRKAEHLERQSKAIESAEWDRVVSTPQGREISRIVLQRAHTQRYKDRMARLGREVPEGPRCAKGYCKLPPTTGADGKPLKLCAKHAEAARQAVKKSKAKAKKGMTAAAAVQCAA